MPENDQFARTLQRDGNRLRILSVCRRCGESSLVSVIDGSIHDWEDGHRCRPALPDKKPSTAFPVPISRASRK